MAAHTGIGVRAAAHTDTGLWAPAHTGAGPLPLMAPVGIRPPEMVLSAFCIAGRLLGSPTSSSLGLSDGPTSHQSLSLESFEPWVLDKFGPNRGELVKFSNFKGH